jgi:hypothetical protein
MSVDNVKKNINEVQDKITNISQNLALAKNFKNEISVEKKISDLKFTHISQGIGLSAIKCGDKVKVIYKYFDSQDRILDFMEDLDLIALRNYDDLTKNLIAQHLVGLKPQEVLRTNFLGNFIDADKKIKNLLNIANNNLNLEIYILSIQEGDNSQCQKNEI